MRAKIGTAAIVLIALVALTVALSQRSTAGEKDLFKDLAAEVKRLSRDVASLRPHIVPKGTIVLWSGHMGEIPSGWTLCNGEKGTPDLRDRFVVGAGSKYSRGDNDGKETHILTLAEMPSHRHGGGSHTHATGLVRGAKPDFHGWIVRVEDNSVSPTHVTGSGKIILAEGNGQPFDIRPPFYALAYIMKVE